MPTTSAVLTFRLCEADGGRAPAQIAEIDGWLEAKGQGRLAPLSSLEPLVFGADFQGLDRDAFATFVLGRSWSRPESVVLLLTPGEGGRTKVYQPVDDLID